MCSSHVQHAGATGVKANPRRIEHPVCSVGNAAWRWRICAAVLLSFILPSASPADDRRIIEEIQAAWRARHDAIKSFTYECRIKESLFNIKRYGPFDDFSGSVDGEVSRGKTSVPRIDLEKTLTIRFADGKISLMLEGERWDHASESRKYSLYHVAFDGSHNRSLLDGRLMTSGKVEKASEPTTSITRSTRLVAVYLWFSPLDILSGLGFQLEKMTVSDPHATVDGRDCVELLIPRGNKASRGVLYVDPSRQYVPVRLSWFYKGLVVSEQSIRYSPDPQVGSVMSAWMNTQKTETGHLQRIISNEVTRSRINEPLTIGDFTVDFPPGACLVEHDGNEKEYFLVLDNGERRTITQQDFENMPPKNQDQRYVDLRERLTEIGSVELDERQALLEELRQFVRSGSATRPDAWDLLRTTTLRIWRSHGPAAALEFCGKFADESEVARDCLSRMATTIEAKLRRQSLIGSVRPETQLALQKSGKIM